MYKLKLKKVSPEVWILLSPSPFLKNVQTQGYTVFSTGLDVGNLFKKKFSSVKFLLGYLDNNVYLLILISANPLVKQLLYMR